MPLLRDVAPCEERDEHLIMQDDQRGKEAQSRADAAEGAGDVTAGARHTPGKGLGWSRTTGHPVSRC